MGYITCPKCGEGIPIPDVYLTNPGHLQETLDKMPKQGGIVALLPGVYEDVPSTIPKGVTLRCPINLVGVRST